MSKETSSSALDKSNPIDENVFGETDYDVVEEETVFQGFFRMVKVKVRHKLFSGGWTNEISREIFCRGDAAAAILYDPKLDKIGLIEQFRIGALDSKLGPWCLEVVAGMIEEGETPEALIRREIKEEAGIDDAELIFITSYYSTPGGCNEKIDLFCALCDLSAAEGVFGLEEENEDIRLHVINADDVFASMLSNRTNNAATLIGLQWLQFNRARYQ